MSTPVQIGQVPWSREDMIEKLEQFSLLYQNRPIKDNAGGMVSPHMFLIWFALQTLKPKVIIESGVWLGQGTWFFEMACPEAELYCIDPNLERIKFRSNRAKYLKQDFSTFDWNILPKDETILFFDDHQNAYKRVKAAKGFGFKHLIFEDNYPAQRGDCYSLKKAFMCAGLQFASVHSPSLGTKLKHGVRTLFGITDFEILPNESDELYLRQNLEVYYEFPPIFKAERTRWGDLWDDEAYPTPEPLLSSVEKEYQRLYLDEATSYTWMCYARLK